LLTLALSCGALLHVGGLATAAEAGPPPPLPIATDRASYFSGVDIGNIWSDLEKRHVLNRRIVEGGSYSVNVRIVTPEAPPLVHAHSLDVWIATAGTATAVTGGTLVGRKPLAVGDDTSGSSISGGVEQALKPGDVVFVPPGVPHGFKDLKDFRAFLIRFDVPAK
jgi:mannose-6-phosphate isomerase-like protein (cupin superfamily)